MCFLIKILWESECLPLPFRLETNGRTNGGGRVEPDGKWNARVRDGGGI